MYRKIFPSSGGGINVRNAPKIIRFARHGCANRPFLHIVVMLKKKNQHSQPIEQLGTFDPMPNEKNEKLISLNFERIQHWLGNGVEVSRPVAELFGLAGFFPVHPHSYLVAWKRRHASQKEPENPKPDEEVQKSVTSS